MFFKTKTANIEPISVFLIERPKCASPGEIRPYHALSFRIKGILFFAITKKCFLPKAKILFLLLPIFSMSFYAGMKFYI